MRTDTDMKKLIIISLVVLCTAPTWAQMGCRFPSERKVINDPKTGVELVFLTSKSGMGDSKIYQTHNQWTADGRWVAVVINYSESLQPFTLHLSDRAPLTCRMYRTSDVSGETLKPIGTVSGQTVLPPRSITTFVEE